MKYQPEKYSFEAGDVATANDFYQAAVRVAHDKWASTILDEGNQVFYNDATIEKWIKNGLWRWIGNRFRACEDVTREF